MKMKLRNFRRVLFFFSIASAILFFNIYVENLQRESLLDQYGTQELNIEVFNRLDSDYGILTDAKVDVHYGENGEIASISERDYQLDYVIDYSDEIESNRSIAQIQNYAKYRDRYDMMYDEVETRAYFSVFLISILMITSALTYERDEDLESA